LNFNTYEFSNAEIFLPCLVVDKLHGHSKGLILHCESVCSEQQLIHILVTFMVFTIFYGIKTVMRFLVILDLNGALCNQIKMAFRNVNQQEMLI